jgi:hypothetical protein
MPANHLRRVRKSPDHLMPSASESDGLDTLERMAARNAVMASQKLSVRAKLVWGWGLIPFRRWVIAGVLDVASGHQPLKNRLVLKNYSLLGDLGKLARGTFLLDVKTYSSRTTMGGEPNARCRF